MTKEEFRRWRCEELAATQDHMAKLLGYSKRTIQDWEAGINKIPQPVVTLRKYVDRCRELTDELRQLENELKKARG